MRKTIFVIAVIIVLLATFAISTPFGLFLSKDDDEFSSKVYAAPVENISLQPLDFSTESNDCSNLSDDTNAAIASNCRVTGCCNSDCSLVRVCCTSHYCKRFTMLPICITGPPCCLEWVTQYWCDCFPENAIPSYVEDSEPE